MKMLDTDAFAAMHEKPGESWTSSFVKIIYFEPIYDIYYPVLISSLPA